MLLNRAVDEQVNCELFQYETSTEGSLEIASCGLRWPVAPSPAITVEVITPVKTEGTYKRLLGKQCTLPNLTIACVVALCK